MKWSGKNLQYSITNEVAGNIWLLLTWHAFWCNELERLLLLCRGPAQTLRPESRVLDLVAFDPGRFILTVLSWLMWLMPLQFAIKWVIWKILEYSRFRGFLEDYWGVVKKQTYPYSRFRSNVCYQITKTLQTLFPIYTLLVANFPPSFRPKKTAKYLKLSWQL